MGLTAGLLALHLVIGRQSITIHPRGQIGIIIIFIFIFERPNDSRSNVVWGFIPLVGSLMTNRSR